MTSLSSAFFHPTNLFRRCDRRAAVASCQALVVVVAMSMSFPPLLPSKTWRNPTVAPDFPGSSLTWRKAMAPRPLTHQPSAATVGELRLATRGNFALLNETTKLKAANARPSLSATAAPPPSKPKLYASVWGAESSVPTFSVWRYCEKHGHAPPSMPAPPISDMKGWFAEYGKPKIDCPPGDTLDSNFQAKPEPKPKTSPKPEPKPKPKPNPVPNPTLPYPLAARLPQTDRSPT